MRNIILFTFFFASLGASAQDAKATELWDPKPKKITAGTSAGEAPSDAIILFSGKDLSNWTTQSGGDAKWEVKDGAMTVVKGTGDIKTKQSFGDMQLHIEYREPTPAEGESQHRGNSGIFLQDRYEIQVLDSYENETYVNGQAGAIYKQHIPLVNACRKPGEWQAFDVIYTGPRFSDNGRAIIPAYVTVLHNGVIIQNHVQIAGTTENQGMPSYKVHGKAPIHLQDHGNPVSFRNIWVREL
jgi:hypothetical protein